MPLTVSINRDGYQVHGSQVMVRGTLDFDSSYPTGGESLTAANLGLRVLDHIVIHPHSGLVFAYDYTNAKVLAYNQGITTGSTAAADSTSGALVEDLAGAETAVRAMGTAVDTTYSFGALKEVADTANLSGVTGVRFQAWGV